jgi:hypothetical protein
MTKTAFSSNRDTAHIGNSPMNKFLQLCKYGTRWKNYKFRSTHRGTHSGSWPCYACQSTLVSHVASSRGTQQRWGAGTRALTQSRSHKCKVTPPRMRYRPPTSEKWRNTRSSSSWSVKRASYCNSKIVPSIIHYIIHSTDTQPPPPTPQSRWSQQRQHNNIPCRSNAWCMYIM